MMIRIIFMSAIILYLFNQLFPNSILEIMMSVAALLAVIISIKYVGKGVLLLGLLFLGFGTYLMIQSRAQFFEYVFAFGPMLNLLTLFALIPILALPIRLGKYADDVELVIKKKVKTPNQLYMVSSGVSYFLSSFMNLASLPMAYYSIRPSLKNFQIQHKDRFMTRSITRGFGMPVLWTPVTPIVGIVIEMTGVNYGSMIQLLIPLSIAGLLMDWMMVTFYTRRKGIAATDEITRAEQEMAATVERDGKNSIVRLSHILLAILLLNLVIIVIEQFRELSFILLISLLVIPFSFAWSLILGKIKEYVVGLKNHFKNHLPKMKDQFFLFLSAGFFISAINMSGMNHTINAIVSEVVSVAGVQLFLVILAFIPLLFAFAGLHPAVTFVLIVEALDPAVLGIPSFLLALAMIGSAVPAFLMGPYNATIGVMSNIIDRDPFKISNWNIPFCAMYLGLLIVALQVVYLFTS